MKEKTTKELVKEIRILQKRIEKLKGLEAEHKKTEKKLKESREQYKRLIQTLPDIIFEVDVEGRFTFVSNAIKGLGYNPKELIGKHFRKIIHPDDFKAVNRAIVLQKYKGKVTGDAGAPKLFDERRTGIRMTRDLEIRLVLKDKQASSANYCYVEISSSGKWDRLVHDNNKRLLGSIGIIKDITKRKKVEVALRKSEEKYRALVETTNTGFVIIDIEGRVIDVNREYLRLLGYKTWDNIREGNVLQWTAKHDTERYSKQIKRCVEQGFIRNLEIDYVNTQGRVIPIEINATLIETKKGRRILCLCRDITKRKKAKETLQRAYSRLEETQTQLIQAEKMEAVGRMASGVAHEVKNPLGIIMQGVNYLEEEVPSTQKESFEILQMIKQSAKRADSIVRALVDFSRATELHIEPENINSILETSITLIQHKIKLENIKIIKKLGKDLPKVLADKGKIEQVFVNIFLNAIQAMPEGGRIFIRTYQRQLNEIRFRVGRRKRDGDYFKPGEKAVVVEIEDTGVGISQEHLNEAFEPFFTTKRSKEGTGLGLAVTRNIIDMHRGFIEMKSEEGKGSKVIITLKTSGGR